MKIKRFFTGTIFCVLFIFNGSMESYAGDIKAKLDSDDGTSKFSVEDSSESEVAHIDSDGNAYFKGNITASLPISDDQAATKKYVDALSGGGRPVWCGYTTTSYNGVMGGVGGVNGKCNAEFSGSHACSYDEIIRLGVEYPYSSEAWLIDGVYFAGHTTVSSYKVAAKDGLPILTATYGDLPQCAGWAKSTVLGASSIDEDGDIIFRNCGKKYPLPCCE